MAFGPYETIRRLNLPGVDVMAEVEALTQAEFDDVDGIASIHGAANFLNALPVERWAIVTSAPRRLALRRLEAAGLPVPPIMVTGEDVANGKPAPDCFLLAAERLGHRPEDCLVFEDAPAGIRAAEAAGAQVLVITATHNHAGGTPHPSITGYGALTPRLDGASRLTDSPVWRPCRMQEPDMPKPSARISGIVPSGKDGWEVHFAAMTRKQAGEDIIMLSVGDHDFDTPSETVEACVDAVRAGYHHYTQLPGLPRLRAAMARISTRCTGVDTTLRGHRHAGRPGRALRRRAGNARPGRPRHRRGALLRHLPGHVPRRRRRLHRRRDPCRRRLPAAMPATIEAALRPNTRAILINTPNNPTGASTRRKSLEGIADICRRHDLWLLSDEVYWTLGGASMSRRVRLSRHGRAHAGHQLDVEEPRHDRLAHRLAHRAPSSSGSPSISTSSPPTA
jgi:sugar-phosphatase